MIIVFWLVNTHSLQHLDSRVIDGIIRAANGGAVVGRTATVRQGTGTFKKGYWQHELGNIVQKPDHSQPPSLN